MVMPISELERILIKNKESFKDILFVNQKPDWFFREKSGKEFLLLFTKKGHYDWVQYDDEEPVFEFVPCEPPTNWEEVGHHNFKELWHDLQN